jgi:hypothetical protein
MNPYAIVGSSGAGTAAVSLRARVMAWHDAMVAHERRLRTDQSTDVCGDECPHAEARALWDEVSSMVGSRANELTFLRSRALNVSTPSDRILVSARTIGHEADPVHRSTARRAAASRRPAHSRSDSSPMATAEL